MKDYKQLFGIAAILFGIGFVIRSFQSAHANMPFINQTIGMSSTSFPYETMGGSGVGFSDLLTVPNDKVFIVTAIRTQVNTNNIYIFEDSTILLGPTHFFAYVDTLFREGNGHLIISPGSTLRIYNNQNYPLAYYIEGYYAEAQNNTYENFIGVATGNQTVDVLTVPNNQTFVLTGILHHLNYALDIYEDNTLKASGSVGTSNKLVQSPLNGKYHMSFAPGSTLRIENTWSDPSEYYIEGYYIHTP